MNKKNLMISLITIVGLLCILVGSIAYYRITVSGSIKGSTGNAVFNVTGFTNESTKEIVLKEGKLVPGDKGSFTLSLDATNSEVDMYVTLTIDRGTLPTNLKFYTTRDYKSELHKYYEFMDTSNQSKDITIYWYWNPYIDDEEDSKFINKTDLTAIVNVNAVQISEYAMMKNGNNVTSENRSEFWKDEYRSYIRMINFINDLSNLPSSCTGDTDLCWDVSYSSTQNKKVYAYLIDSGLDSEDYDENDNSIPLYNLYIASEAPIFAPNDCSLFFAGFNNLISINFNNNFNTSLVTNMSYMYVSIDSSDGDWSSGVRLTSSQKEVKPSLMETMETKNDGKLELMVSGGGAYYIFSCIENLDLSSFNTTNVTDMSSMFYYCNSLTSLDLSSFNTSNVTVMDSMFGYCESLTSLDLSSFNTSNVITMASMFRRCGSLTNLDLSSFNTSKVTDMSSMFYYCNSLTSLDLSSFNTSNVTSMQEMFADCSSLTSLYLSSFNTSKVYNMDSMFYNCSSLTSLDISSFNTSHVSLTRMMFYKCSNLTTTINIMSTGTTNYSGVFYLAATNEGSQIIVNYIADASTLVDNMIATKSDNSNVVKGVQI